MGGSDPFPAMLCHGSLPLNALRYFIELNPSPSIKLGQRWDAPPICVITLPSLTFFSKLLIYSPHQRENMFQGNGKRRKRIGVRKGVKKGEKNDDKVRLSLKGNRVTNGIFFSPLRNFLRHKMSH